MVNSTKNVCKCQAKLVKRESVCNLKGTWTDDFDRLATVEDAKETHSNWKTKLSTWEIVGLNGGKADGPGYGSNIHDSGVNNLQPECDKWGAFIMCRRCQGELIFCQ